MGKELERKISCFLTVSAQYNRHESPQCRERKFLEEEIRKKGEGSRQGGRIQGAGGLGGAAAATNTVQHPAGPGSQKLPSAGKPDLSSSQSFGTCQSPHRPFS